MLPPVFYSSEIAANCTAELTRLGVEPPNEIQDYYGYLGFYDGGCTLPVEEGYLERLQAIAALDPEAEYPIKPVLDAIGIPDLDAVNGLLESAFASITPSGGWSQTDDFPLEYWIDDESDHVFLYSIPGRFARFQFENYEQAS